jgi:hypothetical protein
MRNESRAVPSGRLTYRAVWTVDDRHEWGPNGTVISRLSPPMVSAAIDTAVLRLLAGRPATDRPEVGPVSVVVSDPEDIEPFQNPEAEGLVLAFLAELLAWDRPRPEIDWDGALPAELAEEAERLIVALTRPAAGLEGKPPAAGANPQGRA